VKKGLDAHFGYDLSLNPFTGKDLKNAGFRALETKTAAARLGYSAFGIAGLEQLPPDIECLSVMTSSHQLKEGEPHAAASYVKIAGFETGKNWHGYRMVTFDPIDWSVSSDLTFNAWPAEVGKKIIVLYLFMYIVLLMYLVNIDLSNLFLF